MRMISSRERDTSWEPDSSRGSSSRRIAGGSRGRLLSTWRSRVFIGRIVAEGATAATSPSPSTITLRSRRRNVDGHKRARMGSMPRVTFTANLRRLIDCPTAEVSAATVGEALDAVFARAPGLRGYILDDQGGLRR